MPDHAIEHELRDRLSLIEGMIAEGRRSTESWGWTFVLWGIAYYVAIAWSAWGRSAWAWPVTILVAVMVMVVVTSRKSSNLPHAETTLGRAIGSIWIALGVSMFLLFPALGLSGRLADPHTFVSIVATLLGMANGASALVLRWKVQFASAIVWWAAAVGACFGSEAQSITVFLVAIFLCQIVFGIYCMIAEGQERKQRGAVHA